VVLPCGGSKAALVLGITQDQAQQSIHQDQDRWVGDDDRSGDRQSLLSTRKIRTNSLKRFDTYRELTDKAIRIAIWQL